MPGPHIDRYSFGHMTIDGKRYTSDLIIRPDGTIHDRWWRAAGHNLVADDVAELLEARPGVLIVGTGASGMMRVSDEVRHACEGRGIRLEAARTGEAVKRYNEAAAGGTNVGACFHLTC